MSDDTQVGGAISAIYRRKMGAVIERWERRITAAGTDIVPEATEEELAQFRGQVSNPDDVQRYLERWAGEDVDVEEGLGKESLGEGEDNDSDDIELVITDDDDDDDEDDDDEEMADFIVKDEDEDEE
jgi:phosphopantothenoylcysteine synthetase/decarboxylase